MYNLISLLLHGLSSLLVTFITLFSLTSFLARDIVFDNSCLFCAFNILLSIVLPLLVSLPMLLLLLPSYVYLAPTCCYITTTTDDHAIYLSPSFSSKPCLGVDTVITVLVLLYFFIGKTSVLMFFNAKSCPKGHSGIFRK